MSNLAFGEPVLIGACVVLGWVISVYLIDPRLRSDRLAVTGTGRQVRLARLSVWSGAFVGIALTLIVVSTVSSSVTAIAVLFGFQAIVLDYCSRIRFVSMDNGSKYRDLAHPYTRDHCVSNPFR